MEDSSRSAVLLKAVSWYSFLWGVLSPETICRQAKVLGYEAVALADRNNLCALPEFLRCCRQYDLRPIIAAELIVPSGSVILYVNEDYGYAHLSLIITEKHCQKGFDLVKSICAHSAGLVAVTDHVQSLMALRDHLPVFYRLAKPKLPPQEVKAVEIPCLIVPETVFICAEDYQVHRLLRAIEGNTTLSRLAKSEVLSGREMLRPWPAICREFSAFPDYLKRTEEFGQNINSLPQFSTWLFPRLHASEDVNIASLRARALDGARKRFACLTQEVRHRLDFELKIIGQKGFASYFLIVEDIVKQSPRTCGRGSGAASLVAYCLGITNVDPLRHHLMFERFLNPSRNDPPDLDIDFAWDERDQVLDYVFKKYGFEHVAMVAVHLTFQPRSALRETARVFGLPEAEISRVTAKLPWYETQWYEPLPEVISPFNLSELPPEPPPEPPTETSPEIPHDIPTTPPWPEIARLGRRLLGQPRGLGTHCGGLVITPGPLYQTVPVQYATKGVPIIQWEKDGAEEMGLVKIDLLGNRSLAVIRDALANLRQRGIPFEEASWDPINDAKTINLLAEGKTMGIFYVESPAMRLLQQKTGKGDFDHLVIHSSIIRPAANAYIREYIRRLRGGDYVGLHPILDEVLAETYGIMVYQEDVIKVAMALGDFGFEEANKLRKVLTKKDSQAKLVDFQEKFFHGASRHGLSQEVSLEVWKMMLSFSGYSFCKPHSASYAQVSFQSAYLKTHYPAAFMAAVLSNYGGFYSTQAYVSEAQRLGITLLPPEVKSSEKGFTACGQSIRVGLGQIKGLSEKAQNKILLTRTKLGEFSQLQDFLARTGLDESEVEKLILAGACDSLSPLLNRPQLLFKMRSFYQPGRSKIEATAAGPDVPPLKPYTKQQLLQLEYQMLGFLTSVHPLTLISPQRTAKGLIKACQLKSHLHQLVSIYGWWVTSRTVPTVKSEIMQFITFEDETDIFETVVFPDVYGQVLRLAGKSLAFQILGRVVEEFGAVILELRKMTPLSASFI